MPESSRTRREFVSSAGRFFVSLLAPAWVLSNRRTMGHSLQELTLYVGTYTSGKSEGIYVYRMSLATGELRHVRAVGGKTPRHFAIDPTGAYLLAANQNSDTIHTFRIDPGEGKLTPTGHHVEVPSSVCLKFLF